ncbi:MAG: serine/threonine protein kinase [Polyangiaceae bacterium]|nr:serine/threonine protein kinase [Polyangiaceae bacterium]
MTRWGAGATVGRFLLEKELGEGSWGCVWAAHDPATGETAAVKLLREELAGRARQRMRFLREAAIGSRVLHPGLVAVLDVGIEGEDVFIAFERLQGAGLNALLRGDERMPVRIFLDLMRQCADAMRALHAASVVHRDLKPSNLFVHCPDDNDDCVLKILDFGVSKVLAEADGIHTQTGSFLGTPRYVSPEHVLSAATVDARTDIWSLGVILFEGLSGTFPHQGADTVELLRNITREPPASLDVLCPALPAILRGLVRDCLKPRVSRTIDAAEIHERLTDVIDGELVPAGERLSPPNRGLPQSVSPTQADEAFLPETASYVTARWTTTRRR